MTDPYAEIDALRRRLRAIEKAAGIVEEPRTYTIPAAPPARITLE